MVRDALEEYDAHTYAQGVFPMKSLMVASLLLTSISSYAQSFLVLQNGVTLTTDKKGFVYDFGHFHLHYKLSSTGGNYFIEDKKLSTIDENGLLFEKPNTKIDKVKGKGLNYLIDGDNHLLAIDALGFFYEYDKDDKIFRKAIAFGGNYFLVRPEDRKPLVDLYTVNQKGNYFKMTIPGLNPADITVTAGTYFQTRSGATYTVSKDGFVFAKPELRVGPVAKAGGNFFIDSNNLLYTVSEEGILGLPILPANFRVADLQRLGANFMIDAEGRIFTVDQTGKIFERSSTHDLRGARILFNR
jgi:hypothetical protein